MDMSVKEVWLRNGGTSHEEESAQDGARPRLFCFVDPASRLIVAPLVNYTVPDEQTIAGLLPGSSEKRGESEGTAGISDAAHAVEKGARLLMEL